jgi:hypothetical protein
VRKWEGDDYHKFAFTCGFLSHMAADQIIHPMVNEIAGPYYRTGESRKIHRECEVCQDIALFHELYHEEDFMGKSFNQWVDIEPKNLHNTPDWFRYYIQRAFVESHGVYPQEDEIEDWVDGLLLILRLMKLQGPYKDAYEDLKEHGAESGKFQKYFDGYMEFFFRAVELTSVYWKMVFELYDPPDGVLQITDPRRKRFLSVVQNADLSSPLDRAILGYAKEALEKNVPRRFASLVKKTGEVDRNKILKINQNDVGKFD